MSDLRTRPRKAAELRVRQLPMPRSRDRERRFRPAWFASAGAHLLVLGALIFVRAVPPPPPEEQPVSIAFEPDTTQTDGGPNPSKDTETPKGNDEARMHPVPSAPPAAAQPQINLIPPEYRLPPQPPAEAAEPVPAPVERPRVARSAPSRHADRNPFAHPMNFSFANQPPEPASGGLRSSRSLDLSAGPVIRGGRLVDSVAHVVGRGGAADYMALLREFIETHKYYPQEAAEHGDEGAATVLVTIARDGTVEALSLVRPSGSHLLDAAWLAVFRDNRLPAFTDDMPWPRVTLPLTLNYYLIYQQR